MLLSHHKKVGCNEAITCSGTPFLLGKGAGG
jgi:hypothetical protein